MPEYYYDTHCHMFTIDEVPIHALVKRTFDILDKHIYQASLIAKLPFTGVILKSLIDKVKGKILGFADTIDVPQDSIIDKFIDTAKNIRKTELIPHDTTIVFISVSIDFGKEWQGDPFEKQYRKLGKSLKKMKDEILNENIIILPFLGIDLGHLSKDTNLIPPLFEMILSKDKRSLNNNTQKDIMEASIANIDDNGNGLKSIGIKVYPPTETGFIDILNNNALDSFFERCEADSIPLTIHAGDGGFVLDEQADELDYALASHWKPVLKKYSNLKINFAHLGGGYSIEDFVEYRYFRNNKKRWTKSIIRLMKKYSNVFSDISYSCTEEPKAIKKLLKGDIDDNEFRKDDEIKKIIPNRVLWGTDWPLCLLEKDDYETALLDFIKELDNQKIFKQISSENAEKFLFC